jgi:hypothetical protein
MVRRPSVFLLGAATLVPLLVACGTDGRDDLGSAPAAGETTTAQASASAGPTTDTPAFPADTADQFAEPSGGWDLVFTDVRVDELDGFDRIVLEFTGTGVPGWSAGYVDEAVLDGSGRVVTLGGDAILDIYASGTTWPGSGYYSGPRRVAPANGGHVPELYVAGTFEGYTQVLAGIEGDRVPFRVFALADPARLVVDLLDGSSD